MEAGHCELGHLKPPAKIKLSSLKLIIAAMLLQHPRADSHTSLCPGAVEDAHSGAPLHWGRVQARVGRRRGAAPSTQGQAHWEGRCAGGFLPG